jgi:hypothetical protein
MAGLFEALTNAFGRQFERIAGVPTTRLTANITRTSTTAAVETTLAFPDGTTRDGAFFAGGIRFEYTGKTNTSFTGLDPEREFLETLPPGTLVSLDITTADPE